MRFLACQDRRVSGYHGTANVLVQPFLTDVDSRAKIKGSRDPLGIQTLWTSLGRQVVGNLTTVTLSVREFTTTLLGYYFVERLADMGSKEAGLAGFMKWEQLCGYVQAEWYEEPGFRGVERVKRRLNDSKTVTLSAAPEHQILSNQKIYGLWGLFTVASRLSGLLEPESPRLTSDARTFVEAEYLPQLSKAAGRNAQEIVDRLAKTESKVYLGGQDKNLVDAIAAVLNPKLSPKEQTFYCDHLVRGGPSGTNGVQPLLAQLLEKTWKESDSFNRAAVQKLAERARQELENELLGRCLDKIAWCSSVIEPAAHLFAFLQACPGQDLATVVKTIQNQWGENLDWIDTSGVRSLHSDICKATKSVAVADRWCQIAEMLHAGQWGDVIQKLIEQNLWVTKQRGMVSGWIEIRNGSLIVKYAGEKENLPSRADLKKSWRFTFFLDSLRTISRQVGKV